MFKNGNVYEGEYVKGKREGYGTYTFPDGEKYEGQWFQDQQHGKGIYYFRTTTVNDGMVVCRIISKAKVQCTTIPVTFTKETG